MFRSTQEHDTICIVFCMRHLAASVVGAIYKIFGESMINSFHRKPRSAALGRRWRNERMVGRRRTKKLVGRFHLPSQRKLIITLCILYGIKRCLVGPIFAFRRGFYFYFLYLIWQLKTD